jgi:GMP synthase (glutamine-hydrolysing)
VALVVDRGCSSQIDITRDKDKESLAHSACLSLRSRPKTKQTGTAVARILIFDGAPEASQQIITAHGGPTNTAMFERALSLHEKDLEFFTLNVADGERLPQGASVADFDGVVITGSPLNVYIDVPPVARQIDLAREVFASGVPAYGSCWGLQLMTAALGGEVRLNPKGRELGVARNIVLSNHGRGHFLFAGKAGAFDALCSHEDEVATVPDGATVLASNGISEIQGLEIKRGGGSFLGVQYHPEHTFATTAAIIGSRMKRLVDEGFARSTDDLESVVADFRALNEEPSRRDICWRLGLDAHVTDPVVRTAEFGNWLRTRVLPRRSQRAAAA